MQATRATKDLENELEELKQQLQEANETIEAIRTGQVDAIIVEGENGHQLYSLKSADHTYRVFIEKMTEGAITLNNEGLIMYCNSQFATMVNSSLSQIVGVPFENFIAPATRAEYRQLFENCWKSDCKGEVTLQSGDDATPVQLSLTTLELQEGVSLSIILTDLSQQKATQKQLSKNNAELEEMNHALELSNIDLQQFASVASHDLQEPLRKIHLYSNMLQDRQIDLAPNSKKFLEKIIDASRRMRTLITDILNYSRLSSGEGQIQCVDLNELIQEFKDDYEMIIQETGATIVSDHLPCIDVNRGQMRQVFQNIISNSLKFAKKNEPPVVTISSKIISERSFTSLEDRNGAYCLISIKDNGIGFDEQYISNIFALFGRLNSLDKHEGTGIGMAIARKIIDKHNGLITATSKAGEGACFSIILPLKQAA